jgi:hypothetical protein
VVPGKWLFALIEGGESWRQNAANWVYPAFGLERAKSYAAAMSLLRAQPNDTPVPLPPEGWPVMVTFEDLSNPASVQKIDPTDLAATFGDGVRLVSVSLTRTRAPVTQGTIARLLPWIGPYPEPTLIPGDGRSKDIPFGMRIGFGAFIRGEIK